MSDFVTYFANELWRTYHYQGISFKLIDIVYCICILSIIGMFLNHLIQGFFGNRVTQFQR